MGSKASTLIKSDDNNKQFLCEVHKLSKLEYFVCKYRCIRTGDEKTIKVNLTGLNNETHEYDQATSIYI